MSSHSRPGIALLAALVFALTACSDRTTVTFVPDGPPLSMRAVEDLARTADISSVASVKVADSPDVRDRVLRDLRTRGKVGDRAASLLTRGFPERTKAIPVLVRVSEVDGKLALIAVEAIGDSLGALNDRRLWVFDLATGSIIKAASFR